MPKRTVPSSAWPGSSDGRQQTHRDDSSQDDAVPPHAAPDALSKGPYKPTRRGGRRFRQRKINALSRLDQLAKQGEAEETAMATISTGLRLRLPGGRRVFREHGASPEETAAAVEDVSASSANAPSASSKAAPAPHPHPALYSSFAAARSRSAPTTPAKLAQLHCDGGTELGCICVKNTFIHVGVGEDSSEADQNEKPSHPDVAPSSTRGGASVPRRRGRFLCSDQRPNVQAQAATDSDTSVENGGSGGERSCPSTDWEFPIHPWAVLQPSHVMRVTFAPPPDTFAPDAGTGGTADVAAPDAANCPQSFAPAWQEHAEATARPARTSADGDVVARSPKADGKTDIVAGEAECKGQPTRAPQAMDSIDVLDAFDAFHGSEWLSCPAAQIPRSLDLRDEYPPSTVIEGKARSVSPVYNIVTGLPFKVGVSGRNGAAERHHSCPSFVKPWFGPSPADARVADVSSVDEEKRTQVANVDVGADTSHTPVDGHENDATQVTDPVGSAAQILPEASADIQSSAAGEADDRSRPDAKSGAELVGLYVRLQGLQRKPECNGAFGLVEAYDEKSRRYTVRVTLVASASSDGAAPRSSEMRAKLRWEHFGEISDKLRANHADAKKVAPELNEACQERKVTESEASAKELTPETTPVQHERVFEEANQGNAKDEKCARSSGCHERTGTAQRPERAAGSGKAVRSKRSNRCDSTARPGPSNEPDQSAGCERGAATVVSSAIAASGPLEKAAPTRSAARAARKPRSSAPSTRRLDGPPARGGAPPAVQGDTPGSAAPSADSQTKTEGILATAMSEGGTGSCTDLAPVETPATRKERKTAMADSRSSASAAMGGSWRPSLRRIGS